MISRRGLLGGLLASPLVVRTPGILMPISTRTSMRVLGNVPVGSTVMIGGAIYRVSTVHEYGQSSMLATLDFWIEVENGRAIFTKIDEQR